MALISLVSTAPAAESHLDLSGRWRCALDAPDRGLAENWWKRGDADFPHPIPLPGTTDLAKLGEPNPQAGEYDYHLTRRYQFVGPAWYARDFEVPEPWRNLDVELVLERVMWESRVWIDGRETGEARDSLCVPHTHAIGSLAPGRHRIVIRVDNRMIHPIGDKGHAYGDQTQSRWNGIVGSIKLVARDPSRIDSLRVFPSLDGTVSCEVAGRISNPRGAKLRVSFRDPAHGNDPADGETVEIPASGPFSQQVLLRHPGKPRPWSEFDPHLCVAEAALSNGGSVVSAVSSAFGFREVSHEGNRLLINRRPAFMRGNLECALFPKTGHPPTEVASWARIWRIYQDHGLNHARFHSWCPPEAAFAAADAAGIYLQVEAPAWMDSWMASPNSRPEMETAGHPKGLGRGDRSNDTFIRAEMRRITDTYGNHPSFVFFCIGNELGTSDFAATGQWIAGEKHHDPRHLYAASTARTITPNCDFNATHHVPGIGPVRQHIEPGTDWDYEANYRRTTVPIIAHEIGQWPVYPDWDAALPRYDGVLVPLRLQEMRDAAERSGLLSQAGALRAASGISNRLLYRDEIESFLRTPSCRGFQLLGMQDFTGQGEAMVGWLDPFYETKGTTSAAEFRRYCSPSVPLLRLPSHMFAATDRPQIRALFHHYGAEDLKAGECRWRLVEPGSVRVLDSGSLGRRDLATGAVHDCGSFTLSFAGLKAPAALELEWSIGPWRNTYPLWIYPPAAPARVSETVRVTDLWNDETKAALAAGGRVLLVANRLGRESDARHARWLPLYWSVPFFPGQNRDTLGLLVSNGHPAFRDFATGCGGDWNWFRLCDGARGFNLSGISPPDYRPLAQPVTDFHLNRCLGSIFEARVGRGALLVCGYDIGEARATKLPEVAALRDSLTNYAASPRFAPATEIPIADLDRLFASSGEQTVEVPGRFKQADLLVRCAGRAGNNKRSEPWRADLDTVLRKAQGIDYSVEADGVWMDDDGCAWHGRKLRLVVKARAGVPGKFHVRFADWNRLGRRGKVVFEGTERALNTHPDGLWMEFDVMREDTNDGQLVLSAETLSGPNLMITDIAFVPEE